MKKGTKLKSLHESSNINESILENGDSYNKENKSKENCCWRFIIIIYYLFTFFII